ALLRETVRDEQIAAQVAAARQIPKDAVVQLPDAVAYAPAPAVTTNQTPADANKPSNAKPAQVAAASETQSTVSTANNKQSGSETSTPSDAMPQPKSD